VPKLQEEYIRQGDVAKAEAWSQWAQQKKNQATMKEWSSMYRAAQFGDMEKAADHAFNLYKNLDDGITPLSKETVKDKDGNVTGFNVRLKNEQTGAVTAQFIDKRALIEMGLQGLAPDKMFELTFKRQSEADKAAMEARIKRGEKAAEFKEKVVLQDRKDDRADVREIRKGQQKLSEISLTKQLEEANLGTKERAKVEAKVGMLSDAGYTDDQIKGMMPALVGAGEHKKTTDPNERRALIASDLVKNDPTFSRLPIEARNKKVDEMMGIIYGDTAAPAGKPVSAPAQPAGGQPVYVKDKATGQIYLKQGDKLTPVQPKQAGPAGGMPAR
jgi:hypothetical protein